ncbi:MAG: biotin-dependent carboxyltransferase family protein [Spirochaetes bacterium]|nr:biotin-dependent carboxyltransferase family protein [Spirochaetota bacterium]
MTLTNPHPMDHTRKVTFRVLDPGLLTTVQDLGRWGYQAFGVSPGGLMDEYAAILTNLLVQNPPDAALLEITLKGPTLRFEKAGWVALGGADCGATLDGKPVPNWSAFYGEAGSTLSLGFVREGCRAYIACRGGFDVPLVMGSRSTYLRAGLGGLQGRALREGDVLEGIGMLESPHKPGGIGNSNRDDGNSSLTVTLPLSLVPRYGSPILLRVLLGPQEDLFEPEGVEIFFSSSYRISHEADRMGYRLEGPKIKHKGKADIVSDALAKGAVQVPGHGMPIVMMADHQTTGGYPKIGTVILADQYLLAQGKPGDEVRFFPCTEEEARIAWQERRDRLALVRAYMDRCWREYA